MAIFSKKKNTDKKSEEKVASPVKALSQNVATKTSHFYHGESVIRNPRISEKASMLAEMSGIYVFDVSTNANKKTIASAVKEYYKVTPVKVAIAKVPKKLVFVRGKRGVKSGGKKAYVYLKKGDKIEIV